MAEQDTLDPTTTGEATPQDAPEVDVFTAGLDDDEPPPSDLIDPNTSPEAKDAPDADVSEKPEPSEPKTDDKGRLRGPDGKFAKKSEEPKPEAPKAEEPPPEMAAVDGEAEKADASPPPPANAPWRPNLYGQEVEVFQGALVSPEGHVFIPKEQVALAQALIARGTKYEEVRQERQRIAAERESMTAPYKAESAALAQVMQDTIFSEEWLLQAAIDPVTAQREIKIRLKEADIAIREQYGQQVKEHSTPKADAPELDRYDAEHAARTEFDAILNTADFHGLFNDADKQKAWHALTQSPNLFVLMDDGWKLDTDELKRVVALYAEAPKREQAIRAQQEKDRIAKDAAKRNAAAVPKPTDTPKPAPKAAPTNPDDPYAERPWENPALDAKDRKALYRKHLGLPS